MGGGNSHSGGAIEPETYTLSLSYSDNSNGTETESCGIMVDSVTYKKSTTIQVNAGTTVQMVSGVHVYNYVYYNDSLETQTLPYSFTVNSDTSITIDCNVKGYICYVDITTS